VDYLIAAYLGYRKNMNEHWEMSRSNSFWSFIAMNGTKNIKQPRDLYPLPQDKKVERKGMKPSKTYVMSREQTKAEYAKYGRHLEEWELDKMKFKK